MNHMIITGGIITMRETKYSIIAKSISSYCNPVAQRRSAEKIMICAFKYILCAEMRDWDMPIFCNNDYYEALKNMFDTTGNNELSDLFNDPHDTITLAVKAMVKRPRRRSIKRAKKQVSRVYHDFRRARREGLLGNVDKSYDVAVKAICLATKEAFITTRKSIHPVVYHQIDKAEEVTLPVLDEKHLLFTLFVEQDNKKPKGPNTVFTLEKEYGFDDAHTIQYQLSKYSYDFYYKRRG